VTNLEKLSAFLASSGVYYLDHKEHYFAVSPSNDMVTTAAVQLFPSQLTVRSPNWHKRYQYRFHRRFEGQDPLKLS